MYRNSAGTPIEAGSPTIVSSFINNGKFWRRIYFGVVKLPEDLLSFVFYFIITLNICWSWMHIIFYFKKIPHHLEGWRFPRLNEIYRWIDCESNRYLQRETSCKKEKKKRTAIPSMHAARTEFLIKIQTRCLTDAEVLRLFGTLAVAKDS